jgi:DNA-directed RNA polymerase subunit N (RpoN/RPB10)
MSILFQLKSSLLALYFFIAVCHVVPENFEQNYYLLFLRLDYAESSAIATMLDSMGVEEFCMRYMVAIKQALFQVSLFS